MVAPVHIDRSPKLFTSSSSWIGRARKYLMPEDAWLREASQFGFLSASFTFLMTITTMMPVFVVVNISLKILCILGLTIPWLAHVLRFLHADRYRWHFARIYPRFFYFCLSIPVVVYFFFIGTILGPYFFVAVLLSILVAKAMYRVNLLLQLFIVAIPPAVIYSATIESARYWMIFPMTVMAIVALSKASKRIVISNFVYFPFFAIYGSLIYMFALHFSPGMHHPIEINTEYARHIEELETVVTEADGFIALYGLYEDCRGENLLLTNNGGSPGIWIFNRNRRTVTPLDSINGSGDQVVFNCENNSLYIFETNGGRILRYKENDISESPTVVKVDSMPTKSFFENISSLIYYRNDGDPNLHVLRVKDEKTIALSNPRIGMIEDISPAASNEFYAGEAGIIHRYKIDETKAHLDIVETLDVDSRMPHSVLCDGLRVIHTVYEPSKHILFFAKFASGKVFKYNEDIHKLTELASLDYGLREIAYSAKWNFVVVGNYITGNVYVLDAKNGRMLFNEKLGSRIRGVTVSRDGDRAYIVSPRGILEIYLNEISKDSSISFNKLG